MLKSIELSGFKSFADRTRMEFSDGISALVGPNGSGKSNIVDAIKWVLGEQSVKKLRGGEMTDVIFGGSAGRPPMGMAEVTLSFDNSRKTFDLDVSEVQITRRIYRSGEGEYLINRMPSRLKDIKELLSGTGLGTQAYSIIEQGRVEALLQSTGVQRRGFFEEAAGVSRFNAKKQEMTRRRERVEQNMIRLADSVAELENQLKTSKAQAGKAQLYRQYTERLKRLRTEAGLIDWRDRTRRCAVLREEIATVSVAEHSQAEILETLETELGDHNTAVEELDQEIRRIEGETAAVRERILGAESTTELQQAQIGELVTEIRRHGRQLVELSTKNIDSDEMVRKAREEIARARDAFETTSAEYRASVAQADTVAGESAQKKAEKEETARRLEGDNRRSSRLAGEIDGLRSRIDTLEKSRKVNTGRLDVAKRKTEEFDVEIDTLEHRVEELRFRETEQSRELDQARRRKDRRAEELETLAARISELKQKQSGLTERITLLEELLRKNEGLSPGVREVLRQSRNPDSPFRHVHGLVADIFRVEVEAAALVELALGSKAQQVVVSPEPELFRHIERNKDHFAGRVGFILLDPAPPEDSRSRFQGGFFDSPGVHGRADQFVKTDAAYTHLAQHLLGRTWIVESLAVAKELYRKSDDRTNFLTVSGELLEGDGTLVVGPPHGATGLITRRSELRTLLEQLERLEETLERLDTDSTVARNRLAEEEILLEKAAREHRKIREDIQSQQHALALVEERRDQNVRNLELLCEEDRSLQTQHAALEDELAGLRRENAALDESIRENEALLLEQTAAYERLEQSRRDHARAVTNAKIELAKCEERLDFLKDRIRQFEEHRKERDQLLADHRKRMDVLDKRREQAELAILRNEAAIAVMYVQKEQWSGESVRMTQKRRESVRQREEVQARLKTTKNILDGNRTKLRDLQLELQRLNQEQKTLAERMREDYDIDLAGLEAELSHDGNNTDREYLGDTKNTDDTDADDDADDGEEDDAVDGLRLISFGGSGPSLRRPEDYQKEIEELRTKIAKLGHVNLEAIETLESLETRYTTRANQLGDLRNAKKLLEKGIEMVNLDTQRLFEETFDGVREHFRDLFRQLFGGGHADLVFEDETNPLESGIDIVARPPGKELKNVALLSGGEKTLTCVALLLAFFRFHPNPVCILDECDAALDEGNIDRFVRVIRDFRTETQFLMITHSKKTMACATTLYGVTMQESGVSKPISVRFVDVGENGEILDGAGQGLDDGVERKEFSIDTPDVA